MTEQEREMLAFMAKILADLSNGDTVKIEDVQKLYDIVGELETREES